MSRARDLADDVVAQPVLPVEDGRLVHLEIELDIDADVAHLLPWNPIRLAVRLAAEAAERRETSRPRRGPSRRASAADPISIKAMRGGSPWRSSATSPSTLPIFVWRRSTSAGVTHSNIAEARRRWHCQCMTSGCTSSARAMSSISRDDARRRCLTSGRVTRLRPR